MTTPSQQSGDVRTEDTTTVSIAITIGDVWGDPAGVEWEVVGHGPYHAYIRRQVDSVIEHQDMARTWQRKDATAKTGKASS
jgi:hypothetical protein